MLSTLLALLLSLAGVTHAAGNWKWKSHSLPYLSGSGLSLTLRYANGHFLTATSAGIFVSSNGAAWTEVFRSVSDVPAIGVGVGALDAAYGNGVWVLQGVESHTALQQVWTSSDLSDWTITKLHSDSTTNNRTQPYGIAYGNGGFVLPSYTAFLEQAAFTSSDGLSWMYHGSGVSAHLPESYITRIAFGDGKFIAVGPRSGRGVFRSDDGRSWSETSIPLINAISDVTYLNGRFLICAVGSVNNVNDPADTRAMLLSSVDQGATWTVDFTTSSQALMGVTANGYAFYAFSSTGSVFECRDGKTWRLATKVPTRTPHWLRRIAASDDRLVVNQDNGGIFSAVIPSSSREQTTLTVRIEGGGTVSAGFKGTSQRAVGETYTIQAYPKPGFIFDSWSGDETSRSASLTFTVKANTTIVARFIPTTSVSGVYNGLVPGSSPGVPAFLSLKITKSGAFTIRILHEGLTYSARGLLRGQGTAIKTKVSAGRKTALLTLTLNESVPVIDGSVDFGSGAFAFSLDRSNFTAAHPSPVAGPFTAICMHDSSQPSSPQGTGYAKLSVSPLGKTRAVVRLSDGTVMSCGAVVTADLKVPLYGYVRGEFISGHVQCSEAPIPEVSGSISWVKSSKAGAARFPAGFSANVSLIGSRYDPSRQPNVLGLAPEEQNAVVSFSGGELTADEASNLTTMASVRSNRTIRLSQGAVRSLRANAKNGFFKGTFIHPRRSGQTQFGGVIVQNTDTVEGFFLDASQSGIVRVTPAR